LRKVIKTKASFPTPEAARKLLYLANQNITKTWTLPLQNWAHILNQLAGAHWARFEERLPLR
jgi:putative transposase